jgi:putative ABC transport system ATP-binding protein
MDGDAHLDDPAVGAPPGAAAEVAARTEHVTKIYGRGDAAVVALDDVSVEFAAGRFHAIMGPSGSGKSTLMHCMAGLDSIDSGHTYIGGTDLTALREKDLTLLRRERIGFVFQSFNLVPTLDALENMTLPGALAGRRVDHAWLDEVVDAVGLRDRLHHKPAELSGGQQQRVAIARTLAARPEIVFADEPTGNLDSRSGNEILEFLRKAVSNYHQTIVMVTHDPNAASCADRVVFLSDGRIVDEMGDPTAQRILDRMQRLGG